MTVQHDPQHARFFVHLEDGDAELFYAAFTDDILDLQHRRAPRGGEVKITSFPRGQKSLDDTF